MSINFISMIKNYKKEFIKDDLRAGLSVAALNLPQDMAYALIAGLNPIYGVYTFVVSTIISTFTGYSNHLIVGPTNVITVTIASTLNSMNIIDSGNYLQGVLILTFLTGIIQILIGSLKLGYLVKFISSSVISGLTYGVALIILTGQLIEFLGLSIDSGYNVIMTVYKVFKNLDQTNLYALVFGLLSILIIILFKKYFPLLPSYLAAVVISVIPVYIFDLTDKIAIVGIIKSSVPTFELFEFNLDYIISLSGSAFSLAIISCIQILSIEKIMERKKGEAPHLNREFIGQGITNIFCSFFNSFAITGSFTGSFINHESGAKSRISQLISGIAVLIIVILFSPVVRFIPIPTLAGIVIYVAVTIFDTKDIKRTFNTTKFDALIFITTFITTILTPRVDYAIYLGVIISVVLVLKNTSSVKYSHISYDDGEDRFVKREVEDVKDDDVIIINLSGTMHFNAAEGLKNKLNESYRKDKTFIIRMRRIEHLDLTVIQELEKFVDKVQNNGGEIILCGLNDETLDSLKAYGIIDKLRKGDYFVRNENIFSSTKDAIEEAERKYNL